MSLNYKRQNLYIDSTSIKGIAMRNATPFYVYSYKKIKDNFETFCSYFKKVSPLVCFSVKSNNNLSLLREIKKFSFDAEGYTLTFIFLILNPIILLSFLPHFLVYNQVCRIYYLFD